MKLPCNTPLFPLMSASSYTCVWYKTKIIPESVKRIFCTSERCYNGAYILWEYTDLLQL